MHLQLLAKLQIKLHWVVFQVPVVCIRSTQVRPLSRDICLIMYVRPTGLLFPYYSFYMYFNVRVAISFLSLLYCCSKYFSKYFNLRTKSFYTPAWKYLLVAEMGPRRKSKMICKFSLKQTERRKNSTMIKLNEVICNCRWRHSVEILNKLLHK